MKNDLISLKVFRIIITLFLLIPLADGEIMGQRYQTTTYTEADGLANSMIFDIVQDSAGVLWIGRRSGISSYDGTHFYNYNISDGLRLASYAFLTIDEKGTIWALNETGSLFFSRFDGTKWLIMDANGQIPSDFKADYSSLDVFYDNGTPVILAGTQNNGFILYKENRWKLYTTADGLPSNKISSVRGFGGDIYIASDKGLCILSKGIIKPVQYSGTHLLTGIILSMVRDGKKLWLLGEDWLGYLSDGKFKMITSGFHLQVNGTVRKCFLHAGRNGKVYFGNMFKVFCYTQASNSTVKLDRRNGLISEGGTSVLVDREMNTWIACYRGITKIASERFANFSEKDGLYGNEVASALEVSPGRYVFGHDGALTFYDGKTMTRFNLDPVRTEVNYETRVIDIQKDARGDLWLAVSSLGLALIDKNRHVSWYHEKQGLTGAVFTVAFSSSGNLYAGTPHGLFKFNKGLFRQLDMGTITSNTIRKIIPGTNDTMYLATLSYGLVIMCVNEFIVCKSTDNHLANNVFAFFADSKKRQWVGTAAGLYELAGRELKRVNRDGLMIDKPVYRILEDARQNLWIGTDNGVYRWNGTTLDHFTVTDGLSGQDINRAAGFMDSNHHIWFGTNNGLTVFRPEFDYLPGQIPPPKVRLFPVVVGNSSFDPGQDKELPYNLEDISYNARVISLINERQIFVKYYLEGFDTGWSNELPYTGNRYVFNNLRPGSYRFFLKARNSVGTWSDPVVSATLTILPPFWLRWWFISLALIFFSGMIYIAARFILVNRHKNHLKEVVNLRTRELRKSEMQLIESNAAKDTFFSIIAHDLRNPFNAILGFLDLLTDDESSYSETERREILDHLKSASVRTFELLENLLTWARSQRGSLPFEPVHFPLCEVIAENLGLFGTAAQSKSITLINKCTKDFQVFADRNMVSTVIRNLISNALKFTYPEGTIIIDIELQDPDTILVSVNDNGMGIPPATLENLFKIEQRTMIKGTANETGTGLGLILCKDFIVKNGGTIWVSSTPGTGSTFSFTLKTN